MIAQLFFVIASGLAAFLVFKRAKFITRNIKLGKEFDRSDHSSERWKNMLLVAFGQKKMFKRIIPAILHLFVYLGFLIINIEVLEIVLDGITGQHRIFLNFLSPTFYGLLISNFEVLAVLVLLGCLVFFTRRNVVRIKRFHSKEMTSWPKNDANLILIIEVVLMSAVLMMNGADTVLQNMGHEHYPQAGDFLVSNHLAGMLNGLGEGTLVFIERFCWWLHIIGIMAFSVYITYSKHLHLFLAFPNTFYANLEKKGKMRNMPEVAHEVKMMLDPSAASAGGEMPPPPDRFGAKDVTDLSWKQLMEAYTCTECGRCTSVCPANITGKELSPRKIMMDTRDRMEEVGRNIDKNDGAFKDDGKSLLGDYITAEELRACTTCNACIEACPIQIEPVSIINELRRHQIMDLADAPGEWNMMFTNVENNQAPWQFSPSDRFNWAQDLKNENN